MHVDGFRFDLGAVLGSDEPGTAADADPGWDPNAAFFDLVLQDPTLAAVKLIAEPWTAAGNEQGQFPPRWSEWNGQYRDVMRDFWRDQVSSPRWVGARMAGSPDMYADPARPATACAASRRPRSTSSPATTDSPSTDLVVLRRQAQRRQPREQPGRHRRQPVVELRLRAGRRRADDRPGDRRPAPPPAAQPARHPARLARRADAARPATSATAPSRATTTPTARTIAISWVDWTADPAADELDRVVRSLISLRARSPRCGPPAFPDPGPAEPSEPVPDTGLQWFDPDGRARRPARTGTILRGHSFAVVIPGAGTAAVGPGHAQRMLGARHLHRPRAGVDGLDDRGRHHSRGRRADADRAPRGRRQPPGRTALAGHRHQLSARGPRLAAVTRLPRWRGDSRRGTRRWAGPPATARRRSRVAHGHAAGPADPVAHAVRGLARRDHGGSRRHGRRHRQSRPSAAACTPRCRTCSGSPTATCSSSPCC